MYKGKDYHVRPMEEVLEDIRLARSYYGDVRRVFLCDGDAIALPMADLLTILTALYHTFPNLEKVTAYAGPGSTLRKTPQELEELCRAGLKRVYLGVETGDDALLKAICKGVDAQRMLEAGIRLREAGMELWVMVILGLAGRGDASRRHILATAEMMNQMKPRHLSALSLMLKEGTPLYEDWRAGRFTPVTAEECLAEARLLIEKLEVDPLHFTCDHASNYLPLKGGLPEDREQFLAAIDAALRRAGGSVYRLEVVHGYHGGTQLRDMIRRVYARHPRVKRLEVGLNQGATELVLREYV